MEVLQKGEVEFSETNQNNHMCLEVENIDKAIEHIKAQDVDTTNIRVACADTYQAWIKDPNARFSHH